MYHLKVCMTAWIDLLCYVSFNIELSLQPLVHKRQEEIPQMESTSGMSTGVLNKGSSVSIESTESEEEVKEKPKTKHNGLPTTSIKCE